MVEEFRKKTGIQITAYTYYGARQTTAQKPFTDCAGMKGLKIRVPDVPAYMATPKACGANPTPIAFAEVYLALQNGTVDAQENPLTTIEAKKFYEVQKAIMMTSHIVDGADDAGRAARVEQAHRRREEDLHRSDAGSRGARDREDQEARGASSPRSSRRRACRSCRSTAELHRRRAEERAARVDGLHQGRLRQDRRDQVTLSALTPAGSRRRRGSAAGRNA